MSKNRFLMLSTIDCKDHIEIIKQKNKDGTIKELSYLSWAWAWMEFKKIFPKSYYTVYENPEGNIYYTDGKTCWVKTGVTLVDDDPDDPFEQELIERLYIMDYKNDSIPLERVTSKDVNTTIQRSITKAIARHGLGTYIYAGEDIPMETDEMKEKRLEEEKKKAAIAEQLDVLRKSITASGKAITADMSLAEKAEFFQDVFSSTIGMTNHMLCEDVEKLKTLDNILKEKLASTPKTKKTKKTAE